ncbi:MAG TPA: ACT domain-containing protein [Clostridiales bacterium]|jgi:ACT domain-containing protein|nr:ACT domain-containing protein [Clostridiales bacterium]HPU66443.1 ACT domain-containing protein [Clostridiales bacterium]HQA05133.1 ACT domain-containing protein [Clostridiales bacterium]HQD72119.1 ACT domain-containing protein [Clostridiales bacterium]HXK84254.1 ACT domain-containing protein [Clostridiales bacterium]
MRAIVTVIGHDRTGIIAEISMLLFKAGVNILDINQTVMQEFFTMTMLVDTKDATISFEELSKRLADKGEEMKLNIRIQREDIFNAMHRI